MSFLPEIEGGKIGAMPPDKKPFYTPPKFVWQNSDDKRQEELNSLGRRMLSEDFSDSPALDS